MHRHSLSITVLVLSVVARWDCFAQSTPPIVEAQTVAVDAKIAAVTLYRGRASVTRTATIDLQPGVYDMQFSALPETIQPQTLQARTQGSVKVINVDFAQEQSATPSEQFVQLEALIEGLTRQLKEITEQHELIKSQEQFIDALAMKSAGQAHNEVGTAEFDFDAMRKQLAFIAEERGKLLTARRELDAKQIPLKRELQAALSRREAIVGDSTIGRTAVVTIVATEPGPATLELTYLVTNASWEPAYNVRASISGSVAQIEYDAIFTQRTGEDWNDVRLTLSTAQPTVAANPPTLKPWFVDVYRPELRAYSTPPMPARPAGIDAGATLGEEISDKDLRAIADDATVTGEGPSVSFELPRAVTVKTNIQKQQRTRIASIDTTAKYVHVATPALTDAVYVRGELTNNSAYQLLPGRASIFIGQDYVGPTLLGSVAPNGELKLHFGIDPAIKSTRQLVTKKTDNTGLLSGGRRTSYDYRIIIDNGSGKPISLELWDRYPISRSQEIQVQLVDVSHPLATDAKYVAEEQPLGILKWLLNVPAAATGRGAIAVSYGVRINRAKDVEMTPLPE